MFDKQEVIVAGFKPITRSPKRLIANIQSIKKSEGKTRLAFTARKPIGYVSVEIGGEEGVADGFIPSGEESFDGIQIARIRMENPQYPNRADFPGGKDGDKEYDEAVNAAVQTVAEPALDAFYTAYYASLSNMATTVVDTGTDLYQLARLANFGRLEKIPQLAYAQVKRAFAKLLDDAYSYPGSCVFISHMKDKGEMVENDNGRGKKWQPTGVYETDGCAVLNDKVQAVIQLWRSELTEPSAATGRMVEFNAQIVDSRHSADAMGSILKDDGITFANIGMLVAGGQRSDWE